jgi:hypothetical protein
MFRFIPQNELLVPKSADAPTLVEYTAGLVRYGGMASPNVSDPGAKLPKVEVGFAVRAPLW